MAQRGRIALYYTGDEVINWPGTLRIPVDYSSAGRHNIAGTRTDVWFRFGGAEWHGVTYGEMTQIVHCKRKKGVA
jgi:hypothetical protein